MSTKRKGIRGERELVKMFEENNWAAIRVAGSGSSRFPSPDILAGNSSRRIAMECKMINADKKYLSDADVNQLETFAIKYGAESWIGIKFSKMPWYFITIGDMTKTNKSYVISREEIKKKGFMFDDLIGFRKNY